MEFNQIAIHDLVLVIVILLVLVVFLIGFILLFSFYKYRSLLNKQKWTQVIEHKITDTIVEGRIDIQPDLVFAPYLKERSFRNLFLSVLVSSNNYFTGSAQNEVLGLFHSFGLENEAWIKIKKKSPYVISGGIQELTTMRIKEIVPDLLKLLAHRNKYVYQEVQYSLVNFKGFDGLFFLDNLETPLSDWQQLRLLKSIDRVNDEENTRVVYWLNSNNKSVVIFTLRIIAQYQLLSYYYHVLELLRNPSVSIRKQVVITLQSLENKETNWKLIEIFDDELLEVQLEIMKVLKLSRDISTVGFLKNILIKDIDSRLRINAAEILIILKQDLVLKDILSTPEKADDLSLIIKHALQEKIW